MRDPAELLIDSISLLGPYISFQHVIFLKSRSVYTGHKSTFTLNSLVLKEHTASLLNLYTIMSLKLASLLLKRAISFSGNHYSQILLSVPLTLLKISKTEIRK